MNLENQVCSLELSKRLKELGIKQDSLFIWAKENIIPRLALIGNLDKHELFEPHICSAFTVAELGEILFQKNYDHLEEMGYLNIVTEMIDRTGGYYYRLTNNITDHIIDEFNEADARAKLFIILFENKMG